jgi:hypothetical protein
MIILALSSVDDSLMNRSMCNFMIEKRELEVIKLLSGFVLFFCCSYIWEVSNHILGPTKKKQAVDQAKLNALNSLQQERTSS